MRYISDLHEGDQVSEIYLCKTKSPGTSKFGKSYYSLTLQDKTGMIDGKVWELTNAIGHFEAMDYILVRGQVTSYHTFQIGNQCIKELIETFPFIANWISMVSCSGHLLDETVRMCRQVVAPKSFFSELICDIAVERSRKHLTGTAPVAMSALSVNLIKLIRCYIKVGKGSILFPL